MVRRLSAILVLIVLLQPLIPAPIANAAVPAFDEDLAWSYLLAQLDFGPRAPGTEGHEACADWLLEELRATADRVTPHVFYEEDPYSGETLRLTNIRASFAPEKSFRIALAAHWDTRPRADREKGGDPNEPIPGANDGASGVAVLLALARNFADSPPPMGVDLLLFDGEDWGVEGDHEHYLLGSKRFVSDHPGYRPAAVILLDMVGDADLRIPMEGFSLRGAPHLLRTIFARASALGLRGFDPVAGPQVYDDHVPFLQQGIPAVNLIDFEYPAWHTLGDDASQCSAASLGQVGTLLVHLLHRDLTGPERIR